MRIAQRLYEGIDIGGETTGLITYMRTDGVQIDGSAITQARKVIGEDYGNAYVPDAPRQYQTKAKNAQEAHEAIRPTDLSRRPAEMRRRLDTDQARLYELIWIRTIASQMESAELERTTVDIAAKAGARMLELRATGQVIKFDGFLALYQEGRDDDGDDEDSRRLPAMSEGEALKRQDLAVTQHFTEPPPRFSEASLVKRMEELGIGRPSTYASILQVLKDRGYVKLEKKRLHGEDKGRVVVAFLENFFARYVEYDFTAELEEQLDRISNNEISWQQVLRDFWIDFIGAVNEIKDLRVTAGAGCARRHARAAHLSRRARTAAILGSARPAAPASSTSRPENSAPSSAARTIRNAATPARSPPTAKPAPTASSARIRRPISTSTVKAGRFGPYIQLGEQKDYAEGEKPKRAGIPKNMSPADIELDLALKLLSLPREIGKHPETGEPITAGIGRFGPFVRHEKTYASLEAGDEVFDIGLNRAVTLIAEKIAKGPSGRRFGADPGKPLGDHPSLGGVAVKNGRYGAYVTAGGVNATIPSDKTPDTITLAEAIALIDERAAKGGGKPKRGAKKAAPKKAAPRRQPPRRADPDAPKPAKKAAAKKAAAKPKSEAVSKARAPVAPAAKTSAAKPAAHPRRREEERGQGPGISEDENTTMAFRARDAIVAFIRAHPGKIGTREIAREFGLKNADRVELKRILRELADEGAIAKRGTEDPRARRPAADRARRHHRPRHRRRTARHAHRMGRGGKRRRAKNPHPRAAPPAAGHGRRRRRPRAAARSRSSTRAKAPLYRGRVIKVIDHARTRLLGIFRQAARRRRTARSRRQEAGRPRTEHRARPTPAAPRMAISSASTSCARAALALPPAR